MCRRPLDWRSTTAEEFADRISLLNRTNDPTSVCVIRDGQCKCQPCRCKTGEVAEEGEW